MKKQVPLRLEEDFYKEVRIYLLNKGESFQVYVENLIKEDMKKVNSKGDR